MMILQSQFNKIESFGYMKLWSNWDYLMTSTHILFLVLVYPPLIMNYISFVKIREVQIFSRPNNYSPNSSQSPKHVHNLISSIVQDVL